MSFRIIQADYHNPEHGRDILAMLEHYANDAMGGSEGLSDFTRQNLISSLAQQPGALTLLAYSDDGQPAGLLNAFTGFSTFRSRPLLNIHDLCVHLDFRGQGLSMALLGKAEEYARQKEFCKLTLEVLEGNRVAIKAYRKYGFRGYELSAETGQALFWEKELKG